MVLNNIIFVVQNVDLKLFKPLNIYFNCVILKREFILLCNGQNIIIILYIILWIIIILYIEYHFLLNIIEIPLHIVSC